MTTQKRPSSNPAVKTEIDKLSDQFDAYDQNVKDLTMDRMNMAPKEESEPQTKLAARDIEKSKDIYLKPKRCIFDRNKFNEKFRESYDFDKEYVQFIAENKEIGGENIELWTKPYAGVPAEEWIVPVNKPVWGPRYLAEQIKRKSYHRLTMQQSQIVGADGMGSYYGQLVADTTIERLTARPVSTRKSIFMGANNF